jgi:hypothetical protein
VAPDRWDVLVRRENPGDIEVRPARRAPLAPGEVSLRVERFGLSTNNATYIKLGDEPTIRFFDAFPGVAEGYGRVPVWGFCRVEESRHPEVPEGGRYFGYLSASTQLVVRPRPEPTGFLDTRADRHTLHDWYRRFTTVGEPDPLDDVRTVIRPVYAASFQIAELAREQARTGARSVLITSASSKTAVGAAHRIARTSGLPVIGLTAREHVGFVTGLGLYDAVYPYEAVPEMPVRPPVLVVDFTRSAERLAAIYRRLAGRITATALIGYTDPAAVHQPPPLGDPEPFNFFTPDREDESMRAEGAAGYHARYTAAEEEFVREIAASYVDIQRQEGPAAVASSVRSLVDDGGAPEVGAVLTP